MRMHFLVLAAIVATTFPTVVQSQTLPLITREFRGVWVASVSNIDWPSRRGLSTAEQQAELIAILDRSVAIGLNAVILQIRPAGDALYASSLEPWSAYLTGSMGVAPEPYYDPLAFAVEEAHRRGLELHAWFNPYRARHPSDTSALAPQHIAVRRPDLVHRYGRHLWMDPGEPEVLQHTKSVLLDVVRRYDVDGIHVDDYFYPYLERDSAGTLIPFPDDASWARYVAGGGALTRDDWRRENVDRLIGELYFAIHAEKPWVKFGVSPIGIWRPGFPEVVTGFDAYSVIYADARKWLRNGWLDYLAPQLYWRVASPGQPFAPLLAWWVGESVRGRHVWPGLFTSRADTVDAGTRWRAAEILQQIALTRVQPGATGHIHFSMRGIAANRDSIAVLVQRSYADIALTPTMPWLTTGVPAAPQVSLARDAVTGGMQATLTPGDSAAPHLWTVRERYGRTWRTYVLPGDQRVHSITTTRRTRLPNELVVTAIDRASNESAATHITPRR